MTDTGTEKITPDRNGDESTGQPHPATGVGSHLRSAESLSTRTLLSSPSRNPMVNVVLPVSMTGDQTHLNALLLATGRGNRTAFAQLYDITGQRIYGVISHQLHDREKAERLTLTVFLEIWRTSPRFNPHEFPAWLWIMTCAQRIAHSPDDG